MIVLTNRAGVCLHFALLRTTSLSSEQCPHDHTLSPITFLQTMTPTFASSPVGRRFYTKRLPSEAGINHGVNNQYCRHSEKCCATELPKSPADMAAEQLQESDQHCLHIHSTSIHLDTTIDFTVPTFRSSSTPLEKHSNCFLKRNPKTTTREQEVVCQCVMCVVF